MARGKSEAGDTGKLNGHNGTESPYQCIEVSSDDMTQVIEAQLQAPIRMVGIPAEVNLSSTKFKGIEMYWLHGEGLLIKYKDQKAFVPDTNVKLVKFV